MSGHGTPRRYNTGCRCDDCKAANTRKARADRERRKAAGGGGEIPHGPSGYTNWGCRCDQCRAAHSASLRGAADAAEVEMRRERRPLDIPHGTRSSYRYWGCRCAECAEAELSRNRTRRGAWQAEALDDARNHGKEWTGPELELAAREELSSREVAEMLGRSFYAVQDVRRLLKGDPKFIKLAGLVDEKPPHQA